jgi:hypothetical protein
MTYEGARSISGPFLGQLKAGALVVGVVAGLGEFLGYALRLGSGYLADRLGRYWLITFAGYALNLLAIPLLALAEMVPRERRATGFGLFNAGFGLFWFLGSALMGFLYDFSLGVLVAFSVTAQLLAIPFFLAVSKQVCLQPR